MHLSNTVLCSIASLVLTVDAAPYQAAPYQPAPSQPASYQPAQAEQSYCDNIDKYNADYWNTKFNGGNNVRWRDSCVFYTKGYTAATRAYTSTYGTSIWDDYPCQYYNGGSYAQRPNNELSCIFADPGQRQTYFQEMSRSYAQHCIGKVQLMTWATKKEDIPQDGIWGQVEEGTLTMEGSGVTEIWAIDQNGHETFMIWQRDLAMKREADQGLDSAPEMVEGRSPADTDEAGLDLLRRANMQTCMSDAEYAQYDNEVNW